MKYILGLLLLCLIGCTADPISSVKTNNKDVSVDLLFTHDGCSVYRFVDGSDYHYYAVCKQGSFASMVDSEGRSKHD